MVSQLWIASSEGDLTAVLELLESEVVDLDLKDQDGVTPLLAAAKNGHVTVIKVLLDKGASPLIGAPEQYTSDPVIIDMLRGAAASKFHAESAQPEHGFHPGHGPPGGYFMPPPPSGYAYYPGMHPPPPPDGSVPFYPPPPSHPAGDQHPPPGAQSNLPPPEIARLIPCRYFPACRYGASCMFAHPQGPYYPGGGPPPGQYPGPYENANPPPFPPPNFYPPPNFPSPNGMPPPHMSPMSPTAPQGVPPPPMMHARSSSDMLSPVHGAYPPGVPGPVPYPPTSPISPSAYPNGNPAPLSLPVPPLPMPPAGGHQSPSAGYPQTAVPPPHAYDPQMDASHPPHSAPAQRVSYDQNGMQKTPPLHAPDSIGMNGHRDPMGHARRGGFRRPAFMGRKPPCLFFPSGRCRNGDECRFPHVLSEAPAHQPPFAGRGGRFRPPPQHQHANGINGMNGVNGLEEGLAALNVRDDAAPRGRDSSRGSHSPASASHARVAPGAKNGAHVQNGIRPGVKPAAKQRVPSADDFPVLGGATTPPSRTSPAINGKANGLPGPTAAQVLQAAPVPRKEMVKDLFRGNGVVHDQKPSSEQTTVTPVVSAIPVAPFVNKLPISFAAVANGAPDASKEVSVSA
ncbi:hypothetical protein OF83DRAFT_1161407 [Amylostereum chailletii]|nr:hypothetical protein OF83DRAFT_1161407 [Amylostereum chailletii]